MDKAGFSEKPQKASTPSLEDIPEALRDIPKVQTPPQTKLVFLIGGLVGLGAIAFSAGSWYIAATPSKEVNSNSSPVIAPSLSATQSADKVNPTASDSDTLLGHFAYPEIPIAELQPIVAGGNIKLRKPAAQQFQAMIQAARASGVILVPISGFRSVQDQQHLFFDIKAERGQTATKRAEVSAPPGYSEHHTGYAVDIGDGATPATNLNPDFDKTRAFKWLVANAARFSFELSFPKDNSQGVSYEPWHWRYVGDRQSLETFYKAKNLSSRNATQ